MFDPWLPPDLLDPRTSGTRGPFASDEGMVGLMREAGASQVENVVEPVEIDFADVSAWHRFSLTTGQRAMWQAVPETERPGVLERAAGIFERTGTGAGGARLVWQIRYTVGCHGSRTSPDPPRGGTTPRRVGPHAQLGLGAPGRA